MSMSDSKTRYEILENYRAKFSFDDTEGQYVSCGICNIYLKEDEMVVIEPLKVYPNDPHERPWVSRAYFHESCYDSQS